MRKNLELQANHNHFINAERELFAEKRKYPLLKNESTKVNEDNIGLVYELNNHLLDLHLDNREVH